MVGFTDFRSHSKSGPVATQTLFDHSKSRLVLIADPHSTVYNVSHKFKFKVFLTFFPEMVNTFKRDRFIKQKKMLTNVMVHI